MSLSHLLAGIWFVLFGLVYAGWLSLDVKIVGVLAIVVGVLYILEAASVWSYNLPARNSNG